MTTLKVSKVTSSKNGGFVVTLVEENPNKQVVTKADAFGSEEVSDSRDVLNTYYMKKTTSPANGLTATIDLEQYNQVDRPFTTSEGKDIICKWLHMK